MMDREAWERLDKIHTLLYDFSWGYFNETRGDAVPDAIKEMLELSKLHKEEEDD